jgi:hypothetical protein
LNGIGPFGFGRFESFGVAHIQTIKAIMPVLTLVLMFALKLEKSSPTYTKITISISVGVIIASVGELHFHVVGFCVQAIAVCAEAMRLTLVNVLLSSKGLKLDAMSGASNFFPTCAVLISVCCCCAINSCATRPRQLASEMDTSTPCADGRRRPRQP